MEKTDSRYPYTYACDYVRSFGGYSEGGVKTSRADASQIIEAIAVALDIEKETLCVKLADYYMANEPTITDKSVKRLMAAMGLGEN